ncbi:primase, DNA, polypeptide 1 (49kDa) [Gaertneriomyces sp. JEL0708]|nr:primase, DNA, polypeptide 1 (49kDa) [Gaertneriomyces sp. JEL0708]
MTAEEMTVENTQPASMKRFNDDSTVSEPLKKAKVEVVDFETELDNFDIAELDVDDDTDEVMAISSAAENSAPVGQGLTVKQEEETLDKLHFQSLLKIFYQRLFPFNDFYRWFAYGDVQKNYFVKREWSFELASEAFIRFQSYSNAEELKNDVLRLCPVKMDIGAVYNIQPKDKRTIGPGAFKPQDRELVFDIDMTDYDDVRTCCSGGNICHKCWDFMTIAIKIIHRVLTEDFAFKHILWVYSGRRGVHCWVCDESARKLSSDARRAIVSYMEVVKGGDSVARKVQLPKSLHPSLRRAYDVCHRHFQKTILEEMDVLGSPDSWNKLLQAIPDEDVRRSLNQEWSSNANMPAIKKWGRLQGELKSKKKPHTSTTERDLVFQYTYPRLDVNVSIGLNHLLKAPFCVHPKTGRVCIPIDPDRCEEFDPLNVPTLGKLVEEINAFEDEAELAADARRKKVQDYQKTSLESHIEYFKRFLAAIAEDIRRTQRAKQDLSF